MKKATIEIEGMQCSSCASHVESTLLEMKGVKSAKISVLNKKAIIEYEGKMGESDIKSAIKNAGYAVKSVRFE